MPKREEKRRLGEKVMQVRFGLATPEFPRHANHTSQTLGSSRARPAVVDSQTDRIAFCLGESDLHTYVYNNDLVLMIYAYRLQIKTKVIGL